MVILHLSTFHPLLTHPLQKKKKITLGLLVSSAAAKSLQSYPTLCDLYESSSYVYPYNIFFEAGHLTHLNVHNVNVIYNPKEKFYSRFS